MQFKEAEKSIFSSAMTSNLHCMCIKTIAFFSFLSQSIVLFSILFDLSRLNVKCMRAPLPFDVYFVREALYGSYKTATLCINR